MHLIGINGFKRSGKGTVANIVSCMYNDGEANVLEVGFADKLKIMAARALGYIDLSSAECIALMDEFKEDGYVIAAGAARTTITGRQYLQHFGNQAREEFGDTFWIDMVLPNPILQEGWTDDLTPHLVARRYPDTDCICITDLRYENEAERIKSLGGVVWEVLRPGLSSDGHVSEQVLPRHLVDHEIDNSGSLRDLERAVESAMDTLP